MTDPIALSEFAGISMPGFVDALIRIIFVVVLMTINALALIYLERKILARFQARVGPTRTGPVGVLQSAADALKLLTKEDVRPGTADRWVFELAPYSKTNLSKRMADLTQPIVVEEEAPVSDTPTEGAPLFENLPVIEGADVTEDGR